MDLIARRTRDTVGLDYCPADGFFREAGYSRLLDTALSKSERDIRLWIVIGALCFIVSCLLLVCLFCKLYSRLTLGRCTSMKDMKGKTVVITGANAGIGKETAKDLVKRGARVILACRNMQKASVAAREILDDTGRTVVVKRLDLCSFKSVRAFADDVIANEERLDVLINNAGIVPFPDRVETADGFEQTFQTNHLAPFLLTNLLLDKLKASAPSRIITLSSLLHYFGRLDLDKLHYQDYRVPMLVYSDTKLANVLFTKELARRLQGTGVTANVLHPGAVKTDINSTYMGFFNLVMNTLFFFFGKTPQEGAQTSIHLAVADEVQNVSGKYFMDCRVARPSARSEDAVLAQKLWQVSEKLTGLSA